MNEIDQDQDGQNICVTYQDNGVFYCLLMNLLERESSVLNVSNILGIGKESTPISGFYEPFITSSFYPKNSDDA
jgi:hypothetical protein